MVGKSEGIDSLRVNYNKSELLEKNLNNDPMELFELWMESAKNSQILEPNAMVLSTVREGKPSARVVLLKIVDKKGFVFFTNFHSDKGKELANQPFAALTFFWDQLEKQVRIEGAVEKVDAATSAKYFHSRPRESQIGAWVSDQSSKVENRSILEERNAELIEKFKNEEIIPCPPHWGGYRVKPDQIEFWQGRRDRLHDRIQYKKSGENWSYSRLSP